MADEEAVSQFQLVSEFEPKGDQPRAIEGLVGAIEVGLKGQDTVRLLKPVPTWSKEAAMVSARKARLMRDDGP